jgi:protein SCO1
MRQSKHMPRADLQPNSVQTQRRFLIGKVSALSSAIVLTTPLLLSACSPPSANKPSFNSIDITGADFARDFSLPDFNGQMRTLAEFRGKVVVVFFGFLNCPDICPATMAEWTSIREKLASSMGQAVAEKLQVVFITVDPERDTPDKLKAYAQAFHGSNVGLRGDAASTAATAKAFKVIYEKQPGKSPGQYSIDHTAASFVFDTNGNIRLYVRMGQAADKTLADIQQVIANPLPAADKKKA